MKRMWQFEVDQMMGTKKSGCWLRRRILAKSRVSGYRGTVVGCCLHSFTLSQALDLMTSHFELFQSRPYTGLVLIDVSLSLHCLCLRHYTNLLVVPAIARISPA